jgi:hypothetical protein
MGWRSTDCPNGKALNHLPEKHFRATAQCGNIATNKSASLAAGRWASDFQPHPSSLISVALPLGYGVPLLDERD